MPISSEPLVGITMGSDSDLPFMKDAAEVMEDMAIPFEIAVVSAHRTPEKLAEYGSTAAERGLKVLIAGAGGAAHLPGMLAAFTRLPVIGVPVPVGHLDGLDALLSIAQMPKGVPVATVAIGNAKNAGLLAARILATADPALAEKVEADRQAMKDMVAEKDERLQSTYRRGAGGVGFTS